jgi:hypothetical protein
MTWHLRQLMPRFFMSFTDADPVANSVIHERENALYANAATDTWTTIPKTQVDDPRLHRTARVDGVDVRFPSPFQFCMLPMQTADSRGRISRTLVLYDNAGEDFLPGTEQVNSAAVRHLSKSKVIFVMFDPTQEHRFSSQCKSDDPQLTSGAPRYRQEIVVRELAIRLRRYLHLTQNDPIKKHLVVVVPKFDIWSGLAGFSIDDEPVIDRGGGASLLFDLERVEKTGRVLRKLLKEHCPDFIATTESLSKSVQYIPVTSLGCSPTVEERDGHRLLGVYPKDLRPKWVTVPFLYLLAKWGQGTIRVAYRKSSRGGQSPGGKRWKA